MGHASALGVGLMVTVSLANFATPKSREIRPDAERPKSRASQHAIYVSYLIPCLCIKAWQLYKACKYAFNYSLVGFVKDLSLV